MEKLNNILRGITGEYYVAAELSKRGYIASLTLRNTKGVDILCSNADAKKVVGIQVKTHEAESREWMLDKKVEGYIADNLFYIFVTLNNRVKHPDFFIVPSKTLSEIIKNDYERWMGKLDRKGQKHKETDRRKFRDPKGIYLNRWDLLDLD
jgi:hypothetical protein